MVKNFSYIILDVDGTIFDSKKFYRRCLNIILYFLDGLDVKDSFRLDFAGYPFFRYQKSFSPIPPLWKRILDRIALEVMEFTDNNNPRVFPKVKETLGELYNNRIILLASTASKTCKTEKKLEKEDLRKFFTLVLGSDKVPKIDHIPYFAKHCHCQLNDFVSQAVYVGDTPIDMLLAKKYGIQSIGIANTVKPEMLNKSGANMVGYDLKEVVSSYIKKISAE